MTPFAYWMFPLAAALVLAMGALILIDPASSRVLKATVAVPLVGISIPAIEFTATLAINQGNMIAAVHTTSWLVVITGGIYAFTALVLWQGGNIRKIVRSMTDAYRNRTFMPVVDSLREETSILAAFQ